MHAFGDGAKPVELPRLKRFCIRTIAAAQVTQIISHLTLPPGLCISVVGVEQNGTSFDGILFPFFKDNTLIRPLQDITAVEIDVFADDMDLTTVANGVGTSGAFHTDYSEEDSEDYFDASIQSLAMLNLKELWITGRRPWEDEPRPGITPWRVFNELKLLEKLVIQHSTSLSDIIDSLFPNYDPSSESRDPSAETETPPVPSPHLHCLWITGSPESLTTASTHLVACVSERHYRIGPSLREIRLRSHIDIEDDQAAHWSGSTSYQECIPDLRQYVADVEDVSVLPVGIELPEATQTPYFRGSRMKWPRWRSEHVSGWEEPSKPCE
ncbi:hypothetical protein EUX98_g6414 [Antrodiella citrinella]|uniref:Uncharacterized protein n=1 Tax=Antrodiella citrinella TaxID=2447956 RepID=A0A4S4MPB7_9APHY|nr:hypothetical protein EUX98_g6414 [Antrodiella citrinella]